MERSDQKSKHAKIDKEGDSGESFQGWHKKGIKRFNVLHKAVKESRLLRSSIKMEEELMAKYHAIYGKKVWCKIQKKMGAPEKMKMKMHSQLMVSIVKNYRCHHWIQVLL